VLKSASFNDRPSAAFGCFLLWYWRGEIILSDEGMNKSRRNFLIGATSVVGSAGVVGVAIPFVGSWNPSAKALAAGAPIKVDVSRMEPGDMLGPIPAWRDKPVFVVKRTQEMLASLNSKTDRLADPDSREDQQPEYARNETRSIRPDLLVLYASRLLTQIQPGNCPSGV
jgi:ubiquinol-cytochrome c reductase iron-sulfur subunit